MCVLKNLLCLAYLFLGVAGVDSGSQSSSEIGKGQPLNRLQRAFSIEDSPVFYEPGSSADLDHHDCPPNVSGDPRTVGRVPSSLPAPYPDREDLNSYEGDSDDSVIEVHKDSAMVQAQELSALSKPSTEDEAVTHDASVRCVGAPSTESAVNHVVVGVPILVQQSVHDTAAEPILASRNTHNVAPEHNLSTTSDDETRAEDVVEQGAGESRRPEAVTDSGRSPNRDDKSGAAVVEGECVAEPNNVREMLAQGNSIADVGDSPWSNGYPRITLRTLMSIFGNGGVQRLAWNDINGDNLTWFYIPARAPIASTERGGASEGDSQDGNGTSTSDN